MIVAIGPAAGACCYEVGSDVIDAFKTEFPHELNILKPTRENHACIDLLCVNRSQLSGAGVKPGQHLHRATLHDVPHRFILLLPPREKGYGKVGRLMSVIGRAEITS